MAGPNDSNNRRGMNVLDQTASSVINEIDRISGRHSQMSAERIALQERQNEDRRALKAMNSMARSNPEIKDSPFYQELNSRIGQQWRTMNSMDAAASSRASVETANFIGRQFSNSAMNSRISGMQMESGVQNRSFAMMNMTHEQLEERREDIMGDIRAREAAAQNQVKSLYSGRAKTDYMKTGALASTVGGATNDYLRELATINAAQSMQRTMGTDPNSKLRNLAEMGQVAQNITNASGIAKEVNSGGVTTSGGTVKNADIPATVLATAEKLNNALAELARTAAEDTEALNKHRKTADDAAGDLKKLQDAQKAGGGGGGYGNAAAIASGLAGGFNAFGQGAQAIMINQRMQQTSNVGGFANVANSQYEMYQKARQGDIASQLLLGNTSMSSLMGSEMQQASKTVSSLGVGAGLAQAGAGGAQALEAGAQKANFISYGMGNSTANTQAMIGGLQNVASGTTTAAIHGMDIARNTSGGANKLAGYNAMMEATRAVNAVGASQAQGLRNFMTGLDVVGQGMGGRANAFMQSAMSDSNMTRMANSNLSPEQFNQFAGMGNEAMGSQFSADQIFQARNLEKAGFGNMTQNMGRMAQLAGAGANNPGAGLESVMAAAMTKGLDSSKAINDMVSNTAAMVSTSVGAQMGIDTTAATSTLIAQSMDPNIANKEFAANRAATAAEISKGLTTNESVSFSGMVNTARISQQTGLGGTQAIMAQKLDTATLRSMMDMTEDERDKALLNRGIDTQNSKMGSSKELVQKLLEADQREILEGGGAAFGVGMNVNTVQDKLNRGEKLSRAEQAQLGQTAVGAGFSGANELLASRGAITSSNSAEAAKNASDASNDMGNPADLKKTIDNLRTSGFQQLTQAAQQAATGLGGINKAVETFVALNDKYAADAAENEKVFATAASDFSKNFGTSTERFDKAVTKFEATMKDLSRIAGLSSNGQAFVPNMGQPGYDQKKGPSSRE